MIDFNTRLKKLKDRRQGSKEIVLIEEGFNPAADVDIRAIEKYEQLKESAGVRYAIGSMSEVDPKSTKISHNEGNRVADTLIEMLSTDGIEASKKMQGSVALNVHIEGHSDVDMLIIYNSVHLVQLPKLDGKSCYCSDSRPMEEIIANLRMKSEEKLTSRYYQATVNCSNNKSISLSGGSLKRKVDIVPSCWYNSHDYQRSGKEKDRGIKIYNKGENELILNYPFRHIDKVNNKDSIYHGNLKKVIRLLKNIIADLPDYKKSKAKELSSYDLAGIGYHMDNRLNIPSYFPLALVEQTRDWLKHLQDSPFDRNQLMVPDGTRLIFNNDKKEDALDILSKEVEDLAISIFNELEPGLESYQYQPQILTEKFIS